MTAQIHFPSKQAIIESFYKNQMTSSSTDPDKEAIFEKVAEAFASQDFSPNEIYNRVRKTINELRGRLEKLPVETDPLFINISWALKGWGQRKPLKTS